MAAGPTELADGSVWEGVINLLGVLLGALIAFGSTWWFAWRAERSRTRGLAYCLVIRANEAANSVLEIRRVLTAKLEKNEEGGFVVNWEEIQAPTGFIWAQELAFPAEELGLLADVGKHDLINELSELARLHNILHIITGEFAARRERLTVELMRHSEVSVSGTTVQSLVPVDVVKRLQPEEMLVQDLAQQVVDKAVSGGQFACDLVGRLGPELKAALADKKFRMKISFPRAALADD